MARAPTKSKTTKRAGTGGGKPKQPKQRKPKQRKPKKTARKTSTRTRAAQPKKGPAQKKAATRAAGPDVTKALDEKLRAVRAIGAAMASAVGLDALLEQIVPNVSKLMRAERSTLFLFDRETDEIWSKVAQGEALREIRLKLGQGIAGWVAKERKTANVTAAYDDARFHPEVDAQSGFRTRSVVAVPLTDRHGALLGVLQVLNRIGGPFTEEDIDLLRAIAAQTAYAVENAHLAQRMLDQNQELEAARLRAERRRAELDLLYQLEQETAAATELESLLDSVIVQAAGRMRSEAGSVLLLDRNTGRLYFRGVAGSKAEQLKKISLEPGQGVVGWVAQNGEPLVVNHPSEDPRHDRNLASQIDFPAYALLAVPLVWNKRVIGAVEVLNPRPRQSGATGYDLEDLKVLTLIAGQVARAVTLTQERQAHIDTERLAVIGRMLTGVAHDLRNPMTAISGYAQLMAVEEELDQREKRCDRILAQIDEMTAMIADLLAFARGDRRLNPGPVAVTKLAADVRDSLSLHCNPRGIELSVEGSGGTAIVDVARTKRIVFNLAKNAVDVLGKGGRLSVAIAEAGGGLTVRVSDDGPGIPPSIQTNLFEPFVSAGKVNGTGLGLSIVKRFVEDQGGDIMLESSPDEGTTFVVRLPHVDNSSVSQVSQ